MISSLKNKRIVEALKLRKRALREDRRAFLVEGPQAVGEAVRLGAGLDVLFHDSDTAAHPAVVMARQAGVEVVEVGEEVIRALTSTVTPQGLVGIGRFVDVPLDELPQELSLAALLYAIRDPGNAGTVLRSADAAGADAVVFSSEAVDVYNPKTVRSSAGSLFHLPVVRDVPIREAVSALRGRGVRLYAMAVHGERRLHDLQLREPSAFLFGNEAWGLPEEVAALADATVSIPIANRVESLNLAAAATVCLFEAARQRAGPSIRLSTVIAGAAHDIRSPLTALKGFGSTLARRGEDMAPEDRRAMLEAMAYDADRMGSIIGGLLDVARIAEGTLETGLDRVSTASIAQRVAASAIRNPDHPEVHWIGEDLTFSGDPERVGRALGAMLDAATWWAEQGPIEVSAEESDHHILLRVARAGSSIDPASVADLLQARRPGSGGGGKIGLYAARLAAESEGGSLSLTVDGEGLLTLSLLIRVPPL